MVHNVATPGLDDVTRDPSCAAHLSKEALLTLLLRCSIVHGIISGQLAAIIEHSSQQQGVVAPERLLNVREAAERLAVPPDWLYRNAKKLPFTVRLGPGLLRFSSNGIDRYIRQRQGSKA